MTQAAPGAHHRDKTRWVEHQMTSIRIAVAAVLATAAVLAGAPSAAHSAPAKANPATITEAGPVPCCPE
jgi:hypothetical protein